MAISQGLVATTIIASFVSLAVCTECECFPRQEPRICCEYECEDEEACDTTSQVLACIFTQNVRSMECNQVLDCRQICSGAGSSQNECIPPSNNDPGSCHVCAQDSEQDSEQGEQDACMMALSCILSENVSSQECRDILQEEYGCSRVEEDSCDLEDEDSSRTFTEPQDQEGSPSSRTPQPPPPPSPSILVPAIVCATAVILVIAMVVLLALYWKFRIKLLKEKRHSAQSMNTNVHDSTAISRARTDPLYSVIGQQTSCLQPPALPPDRVPYYQEIQSDIVAAANCEESVSSVKSVKMAGKTEEANATSDGMEPYQEPADALK